ncbi:MULTISPECIES: TIGR04222 domain-containing membrane protein [unclassified Streptomyces]|uniref:TIGR04222 domain-containing membrane protein n=1 Tax=unclassified Streptomyces TaxID=2593676 RepID=UPI0036E072F9
MLWTLFLLVAWGATAISCVRLCVVSTRAGLLPDASTDASRQVSRRHELTLYETAFLAGGPSRVVDLTLVAMHLRRRLLLAHTGWATVVDPDGRDDMERMVIHAIGPEGQSRIPSIRTAATAADPLRALADRLVTAGLALPRGAGTDVATAVRAVRGAALLVVALGAAALLMPGQDGGGDSPAVSLLAWFGLPLTLAVGCLVIVRVEAHPYNSWASPAGQQLLTASGAPPGGSGHDLLATLAVRGVSAVDDPALRAALDVRHPHD